MKPRAKVDGFAKERDWVRILRARGGSVLPCFEHVRNNEATAAPMLLNPDSNLTVMADCMVWSRGLEAQIWTEVKAKEKPGYMRIRSRHEHGCDYRKWQEYRRLVEATRLPLYVVVWEEWTPEPNARKGGTVLERRAMDIYSGEWVYGHAPKKSCRYYVRLERGTWLFLDFPTIEREGTFMRWWPSAGESRKSGGGWLWKRGLMQELDPQLGLFDAF